MIQDITSQYTPRLITHQKPSFERSPQEHEVESHHIAGSRLKLYSERSEGLLGEQGNIGSRIDQHWHIWYRFPRFWIVQRDPGQWSRRVKKSGIIRRHLDRPQGQQPASRNPQLAQDAPDVGYLYMRQSGPPPRGSGYTPSLFPEDELRTADESFHSQQRPQGLQLPCFTPLVPGR